MFLTTGYTGFHRVKPLIWVKAGFSMIAMFFTTELTEDTEESWGLGKRRITPTTVIPDTADAVSRNPAAFVIASRILCEAIPVAIKTMFFTTGYTLRRPTFAQGRQGFTG